METSINPDQSPKFIIAAEFDANQGGTVTFKTEEHLKIGDYLALNLNNEPYYYEVINIQTTNESGPLVLVKAKSIGCYHEINGKSKTINIRTLLGKTLTTVTDYALMAKIDQDKEYI